MNATTELVGAESKPLATQSVTPASLLSLAVEQGADLDRLEKLMDLQQRWEQNEARKAYVSAMAEFKKHPPEIIKDKHVKFGNTEYNHATLGKITESIGSALSDHGFAIRWDTDQSDGLKVTCVITHEMGHSESMSLSAPPDSSGSKNSIQAIASTLTYLQRYTLLSITGLAASEADNDGQGSGKARMSEEHLMQIHAAITENELNEAKFIQWIKSTYKVNSVEEVYDELFPNVWRTIQTTITRKEKAA